MAKKPHASSKPLDKLTLRRLKKKLLDLKNKIKWNAESLKDREVRYAKGYLDEHTYRLWTGPNAVRRRAEMQQGVLDLEKAILEHPKAPGKQRGRVIREVKEGEVKRKAWLEDKAKADALAAIKAEYEKPGTSQRQVHDFELYPGEHGAAAIPPDVPITGYEYTGPQLPLAVDPIEDLPHTLSGPGRGSGGPYGYPSREERPPPKPIYKYEGPYRTKELAEYYENLSDVVEQTEATEPFIDIAEEGLPKRGPGRSERAQKIIKQHGGKGAWKHFSVRPKSQTAGMDFKRGNEPTRAQYAQAIADAWFKGDKSQLDPTDVSHFKGLWGKDYHKNVSTEALIARLKKAQASKKPITDQAQAMLEEIAVEIELRKAQAKNKAGKVPVQRYVPPGVEVGDPSVVQGMSEGERKKGLLEQENKFRTDLTKIQAAMLRLQQLRANASTPLAIRSLDDGIRAAEGRIKALKQNIKSLRPKGRGPKGKLGLIGVLGYLAWKASQDENASGDAQHAAIDVTALLNGMTYGDWDKWKTSFTNPNTSASEKNTLLAYMTDALEKLSNGMAEHIPPKGLFGGVIPEQATQDMIKRVDIAAHEMLTAEERAPLVGVERPKGKGQPFTGGSSFERMAARMGEIGRKTDYPKKTVTGIPTWLEAYGEGLGARPFFGSERYPIKKDILGRDPYTPPELTSTLPIDPETGRPLHTMMHPMSPEDIAKVLDDAQGAQNVKDQILRRVQDHTTPFREPGPLYEQALGKKMVETGAIPGPGGEINLVEAQNLLDQARELGMGQADYDVLQRQREAMRNLTLVPPPETARPPGTRRPKALIRPQGYDVGGRHGRLAPSGGGPLVTIPPIDVSKLYPEATPVSGRFRPIPHLDTLAKSAGAEAVVALDVARKTHPEMIEAIEKRIQGTNINRAVGTGIGIIVFTDLIQILTNPDIPWASKEYYGGYEPDPTLPPGVHPSRRTGERTQEYTKRQALEEWAWQIPDLLTLGGLGAAQAAGSMREQMEAGEHVDLGPVARGALRGWEEMTEPAPYRQDVWEDDTERAAAEVKALTGAPPTEFGPRARTAIGAPLLDKETLKYQSLSPEEKQGYYHHSKLLSPSFPEPAEWGVTPQGPMSVFEQLGLLEEEE